MTRPAWHYWRSPAQKALAFGLNPVMAALLGMLTGIGGGVVPSGAGVVVIGATLGLPSAATMAAGAIVCFALRMLAVRRGWQLLVAGGRRSEKADESGPNA